MPMASRLRPWTLGARPTPIRISSTASSVSPPGCRMCRILSVPRFSTRDTAAWEIRAAPSRSLSRGPPPRRSGYGGSDRPGARGNHCLAETEHLVGYFNRIGAGESGLSEEDVHAQAAVPVGRVVGADGCPEPAHAFHDGWEVDSGAGRHLDAELGGVAHLGVGPRRADQRLGRHTADVQA